MQRYFLNEHYKGQNLVRITGEDVHHIGRVMRMKIGDHIWVVFNESKTASAAITNIEDTFVEVEILGWEPQNKELPVQITVASGLPKGDKLEWIIQKGTELGAFEFVPFIADRSVVKWDKKKEVKKIERWNKIAKEAAEQAHRQVLPSVHPPFTLTELIEYSNQFTCKLVAYEEAAKEGETSSFAKALQTAKAGDSFFIVYGPEGGLSEKEKDVLINNNFVICGLGPRILRTETAPLYTLAAISYHFELMR